MKPLIILLVSILATFLMILSFSNSQQYSPSIPNVTLENDMLDIANAVLPNNQPVWCKDKYEYDIILKTKYREELPFLRINDGEKYAIVTLYKFDILEVAEGIFDDKELKFFRVDVLEKGVKYKLLTLRGNLTFWLKKDGDRYLITNINLTRVTK